MLDGLFELFDFTLIELSATEFFIGLIASASLYAIGCLIKIIVID